MYINTQCISQLMLQQSLSNLSLWLCFPFFRIFSLAQCLSLSFSFTHKHMHAHSLSLSHTLTLYLAGGPCRK